METNHANSHHQLQKDNAPQISALLRLSRKYEVQHLWDSAFPVLVSWHPTTLEGFQQLYDSYKGRTAANPLAGPTTAMSILNLVRELGLRSMLPVAIFRCAQYPLDTILVGNRSDILDLRDQITCAKVREKLLWGQAEIYAFTTRSSIASCTTPIACPNVRLKLWGAVKRAWVGDVDKPSEGLHIQPWAPILQWDKLRGLLCKPCLEQDEKAFKAAQASLWQRLPEICGLESWETLMDPID